VMIATFPSSTPIPRLLSSPFHGDRPLVPAAAEAAPSPS
jgi:hypothetical protein